MDKTADDCSNPNGCDSDSDYEYEMYDQQMLQERLSKLKSSLRILQDIKVHLQIEKFEVMHQIRQLSQEDLELMKEVKNEPEEQRQDATQSQSDDFPAINMCSVILDVPPASCDSLAESFVEDEDENDEDEVQERVKNESEIFEALTTIDEIYELFY